MVMVFQSRKHRTVEEVTFSPMLAFLKENPNNLSKIDKLFQLYFISGRAGEYYGTMQYEIKIEPYSEG